MMILQMKHTTQLWKNQTEHSFNQLNNIAFWQLQASLPSMKFIWNYL